jgi:hypothetical protein
MLMTSKKDEDTLRFYEKADFDGKEKTAFIVGSKAYMLTTWKFWES